MPPPPSSSKGSKGKPSLADLGLSTPLPAVLQKSRQQLLKERVTEKKEKNRRIKETISILASNRAVVGEHRDYVTQQAEEAQSEKEARKRALHVEHVKAQNQRKEREKEDTEKTLVKQRVVVKEMLENDLRVRAVAAEEQAQHEKIMEEMRLAAPDNVHITVRRSEEQKEQRSQLPVLREEQTIMEAVLAATRGCVLVCGETGSGKTTQVPQFLWESGFGHAAGAVFGREGMIAVTEPRRVAAVSMARRVAEELNVGFGEQVCYHVRYDNNLSDQCCLKFVTEGILLKEVQSDFLLRRYSAVVIDEAHERSISGDILIGLLSRIVPLRYDLFQEELRRPSVAGDISKTSVRPLKLIVMSATMRVSDFRDNRTLFPQTPPLINVEARLFPVTCHFSKRTELRNYVKEAFKKVCQIHKKLPPGGILVFLSTQREIETLCEMLQEHYANTRIYYNEKHYNKHSQLASRRGGGSSTSKPIPGETASSTARNRTGTDDDGDDDDDADDGVPRKMRTQKKKKSGGVTSAVESLPESGWQEPSLDSFGLEGSEYALDGDEGAADADEDAGMASAFPGARDDFDYRDVAFSAAAQKQKHRRDAVSGDALAADWIASRKRGEPDSPSHGNTAADEGEMDGEDDEEGPHDEDDDEWSGNRQNVLVDGEDEDDGEYDTLHVLPLYALLDFHLQQQVFQPPPPGKRLCVVATNVAETSITIPNIRYVVDTGREKTKTIDATSGATKYEVGWTSQASSQQRSGRAGRTGPGHCYRLYSTAVYTNLMSAHSTPEILRTPLESVVLLMKHIGIDHVGSFPFPTKPSEADLQTALVHLVAIGALYPASKQYRITPLGQQLVNYPIPPRFARMIAEVWQPGSQMPQRLKDFVVIIAAVYASTTTVFTPDASIFRRRPPQPDEQRNAGNAPGDAGDAAPPQDERYANVRQLVHGGSDFITVLRAFGTFFRRPNAYTCSRYCLVQKPLREARQLFFQLRGIALSEASEEASAGDGARRAPQKANAAQPCAASAAQAADDGSQLPDTLDWEESDATAHARFDVAQCFAPDGSPHLSREEEVRLRQAFAVGLVDQIARRATVHECRSHGVVYADKKTSKAPYLILSTQTIAYVHPSSACAATQPPPEYVAFSHLQQSVRSERADDAKMMMLGVTSYYEMWLREAGIPLDAAETPSAR